MGKVVRFTKSVSLPVREKPGPPEATDLVRSRLLSLFDIQASWRLALVLAPAGFGKTTLLEHLCWSHRQRGGETAWLNLDERDGNEPHLAQRLDRAASEVSCHADAPPSLILIDGLERIHSTDGERLLVRFAESLPAALRIVAASRLPPSLGGARMQLRKQLLLVGADELRLEPDECGALLERHGPVPRNCDIRAFQHLTGGWPAAVRIAALAHEQARGRLDFSKLILGDMSTWPLIEDYINEELLAPLSNPARRFVLETAPLVRFTLPLARAVTSNEKCGEIISSLERDGILVKEANVRNTWYRYQPLFARCLECRLEVDDEARLANIHLTAMKWHRDNGLLSDAVRHAFAADCPLVAADLLEMASRQRRRLGRIGSDAGWSRHLSSEAFESHPQLHVEAACSFATRFELEAARVHLSNARHHYANLEPVIRDDLYAVDAMIAIYSDHPEICVETAERGLRDCEGRDPYTLGTLRLVAANGWIARSALDKARGIALEALGDNERAGSAFGMAVAHAVSGLTHLVAGALPQAAECWSKAEDLICADKGDPDAQKVSIAYLPELHYLCNDLASAEAYVDRCLKGGMNYVLPDMLMSFMLTASRLAHAQGDDKRAASLLAESEVIAIGNEWPRFSHAIAWERVRLALSQENLAAAARMHELAQELHPFVEPAGILTHATECEANLVGEMRYETVVRPSPATLSRLRAAVSQSLSANRILRAVKLLVIEAMCRDSLGDRPAALRTMLRALELGTQGRLIRSVLDEGPRALALVRELAHQGAIASSGVANEYVSAILAGSSIAQPRLDDEASLLESLSIREKDILRLLFDGHSNAAVARRACVSENTVKWHLQNIYSKLNVKNRTGAVAAVRSLGLFD